jgi:hypothetical protein
MYKTQRQHKINHCGYKKKPSKKEINAHLSMLEDLNMVEVKPKAKVGIQLKIEF